MTTADLRIGVVGAGLMGADHIARITQRINGAAVSAVVEPDADRAAAAAATAPGARTFARLEDALDAVDAVLVATPGQYHEAVLVPALEARLPILCEKPLTPDPESSWRVLQAEQKLDRPHIQVGFMRRFDPEYQVLKQLIDSGEAGQLSMLRCVHRNPAVPDTFTQPMLITDAVVHELDVAPWLAGSDIESIEVKYPRRNHRSPGHLREPILVLMQLANGVLVDVELNVSVQFGYQVATEAVFDGGIARIGQPSGMQTWTDGTFSMPEHRGFKTRFAAAFESEIQRWVDAVKRGTIDGPNAWDAYRVALACEAGVKALDGGIVPVEAPERPAFYARA